MTLRSNEWVEFAVCLYKGRKITANCAVRIRRDRWEGAAEGSSEDQAVVAMIVRQAYDSAQVAELEAAVSA
jgi:hypothetical protein